jgi:glycosyltransferase involved in cell wall biosynthesis
VAVVEALAMGLPLVATAVGVVPDVMKDGVEGRVVPPRRPDLLAEAIVELATNHERRRAMAQSAFRRGSELDISRTVLRVEAIYREVARS